MANFYIIHVYYKDGRKLDIEGQLNYLSGPKPCAREEFRRIKAELEADPAVDYYRVSYES